MCGNESHDFTGHSKFGVGNSTATATRKWSTRRQMLWWSRKIRRGAHECNLTGKQVLVYIIINLHVPLLLICINIAAEKAAFTADPAVNGFCGLSASSIDGPSWHEARPQSSVHHEALVKCQRLHQQERKRSRDACSVSFPQNRSRSLILFYGLPAQPGRPVAWNSLMSDGKSLAHECGDKTPSITWASRPRRIEALDELEALGKPHDDRTQAMGGPLRHWPGPQGIRQLLKPAATSKRDSGWMVSARTNSWTQKSNPTPSGCNLTRISMKIIYLTLIV